MRRPSLGRQGWSKPEKTKRASAHTNCIAKIEDRIIAKTQRHGALTPLQHSRKLVASNHTERHLSTMAGGVSVRDVDVSPPNPTDPAAPGQMRWGQASTASKRIEMEV